MKTLSLLLTLSIAFVSSLSAETVKYTIDSVHSGVEFKIRHFINKVPGDFSNFTGEIHYNKEDLSQSKAIATIQVASVDTRNADRDGHLQNEDFFVATKYPEITFESTSWEAAGENKYKVTGDLTIVGQTHPVTLDVVYLGEVEGRGKFRSGWEGTTTIDRTLWGMDYGASVGAIGKEVQIELNIQAHRE